MSNDEVKNRSFCVLPWIHSFVNNSGDFQVCCTGEVHNNELRDESGKILNVRDRLDLNSIFNSDSIKKVRKQMLNGKLPDSCLPCINIEKSNSHSRRMIENNEYISIIDQLISQTNSDGSIDPHILHSDYRLGTTCNLKCRMCNPKASSKWESDFDEMTAGIKDDYLWNERYQNFNTLALGDQEIILKDFQGKEEFIQRIHFGGGEPLLSKGMLDILKYCIGKNRAKDITISYNTNLTILPAEVLESWKHFKEVKLLASIDAVGALNEYIRYPSKWSDVDKNLKFLDLNYETYNISEILVSTTVQANNILHLHHLYNYLSGFNFIKKIPNLVVLEYPTYLALWLLPEEIKEKAIKLMRFISTSFSQNDTGDDSLIKGVDHCIKTLKSKIPIEIIEHVQNSFYLYTERFDSKHDLNFLKVNPEFKQLFDFYKNQS